MLGSFLDAGLVSWIRWKQQTSWTLINDNSNKSSGIKGKPQELMNDSRTVFLVDDDPSVRRALTRLIRSAGYDVHALNSAQEFLEWWRATDEGPACLVLDVSMPGMSGMDLQHELQAADAWLPIIFITGHGDIPMGVKAMKDGAVDFLTKPVKDVDLLEAIENALARAAQDFGERKELKIIQRRLDTLTPRERQVMTMVVRGLLNKQIAFEIGTVEKTVKVHRARVMEKMAVQSLAGLVRIAERVGLNRTRSSTS